MREKNEAMIDFLEALKTSFQLNGNYKEALREGYQPLDLKTYRQFNKFRPNGPKPLFCYLPFNSLTFSFGGQVFVCSYNRDVELGKYPLNSIDEIWNGPEAKKLRGHMLHNDLEYGCRHCKYFFDKGKFTNLRPLVFDKYYKNTDAEFPQVFEFEISNECNLECQMCHGEVSSSIRKNRDKLPPIPTPYDDAFVAQLEKYIPRLKEAKFYGGEPFLIPVYYKIWDKVKELNPGLDLFVITNGTHWNSKIERLINELNFDVAISIDAFEKEKLERIRKNVVYEKLLENIRRFSEICNRKNKHLSLSFTVQKDNWEQFPLIINLCNEVNAYIYVSYLERPVRFALADLSKAELQKIRDYMNGFSFPLNTAKEKHNNKCFEDFKHYLDVYLQQEEVKKYHDYDFNRDQLLSRVAEEKEQFQHAEPIAYSDFLSWIESMYASDEKFSSAFPKEIFLRKINSVCTGLSDEQKSTVLGHVRKSDLLQVLLSVKDAPEEALRQNSLLLLEKYNENTEAVG